MATLPKTRNEALRLLTANLTNDADKKAFASMSDEALFAVCRNMADGSAKKGKMEADNIEEYGGIDRQLGDDTPEADDEEGGPGVRTFKGPRKETMNAQDREVMEYGRHAMQRDKVRLAKRLTVNVSDPERRKAVITNLLKKSIAELNGLAELIPAEQPTINAAPSLTGNAWGFDPSQLEVDVTENAYERDSGMDLEGSRRRQIKNEYGGKRFGRVNPNMDVVNEHNTPDDDDGDDDDETMESGSFAGKTKG
jgi:hypothetical protein